MKNCVAASVSDLEAGIFCGLSVRFFKTLKGWPVSIARADFPENTSFPYGMHKKTAEFVYVIKGEAKAYLGDKSFNVGGGGYLWIPAGVRHRFVTGREPMAALSVFCPPMTFDNLDAAPCGNGKAGTKTRSGRNGKKRGRKKR